MKPQPHSPVEVRSVLKLHPDFDLAVRCLEYIRQNFGLIVPERAGSAIHLIALCHHHPNNVYPALAVVASHSEFPDLVSEEIETFTKRIDDWVEAQSLPVLVAKAGRITAPSWAQLKKDGMS